MDRDFMKDAMVYAETEANHAYLNVETHIYAGLL